MLLPFRPYAQFFKTKLVHSTGEKRVDLSIGPPPPPPKKKKKKKKKKDYKAKKYL